MKKFNATDLKDPFWTNALGKISGIDIQELENHLRYKNRFILPKKLQNLINEFAEYQLRNNVRKIDEGSIYYRARINSVNQNDIYPTAEMGAPPKEKAGAGRINPDGIPYLYLASTLETAVAEMRPWKGAKVSVGEFTIIKPISVVCLDVPSSGETKHVDGLQHYPISTRYFSTPTHKDDKHAYLASQYIIESIKNQPDIAIHGVQYQSVQNLHGHNIAIFDNFNELTKISTTNTMLVTIKNISYEYELS
jgi:RES domain-containing protein